MLMKTFYITVGENSLFMSIMSVPSIIINGMPTNGPALFPSIPANLAGTVP